MGFFKTVNNLSSAPIAIESAKQIKSKPAKSAKVSMVDSLMYPANIDESQYVRF